MPRRSRLQQTRNDIRINRSGPEACRYSTYGTACYCLDEIQERNHAHIKPGTGLKRARNTTRQVRSHLKSSRTRIPPCPHASGSVNRSKYENQTSDDTLFVSAAASVDSPATEQNA